MATANLMNEREGIITGNDNVVIVNVIESIRGGRTLDVSGFDADVINAGHPIVHITATDEYQPLPVAGVGGISSIGAIAGGSAYNGGASGSFPGVALTGGSGTTATANITLVNGVVTSVVIVAKGKNYVAGDTLSAAVANLGNSGGTGFTVKVATAAASPTAYGNKPGSSTYAGILINSIRKSAPFAGIMYRGTVNPAAAPFPMDSTLITAIKVDQPLISFKAD